MKFSHCPLIPVSSLKALRSQMEFKIEVLITNTLNMRSNCGTPTLDVVHAKAFGLVATGKMSS